MWINFLLLWSYVDFMRETLNIVNAAVNSLTYFYIWAAHCLKAIHIPYRGIHGTVYGRIYTVFFRISCREGTEIR